MLDRDGLRILPRHVGDALRGRTVEHAGGGDGYRRQHADRVVADMRNEAAGRDGAAGTRCRDQRHLRVVPGRDVAKLHGSAAGDAQPLDPRLQFGIGVELIDALIAGAADIGGFEDHQRHAVVDAGYGNTVDHVAGMAGRQQSRRHRARGIEKVDLDRRGSARRAVDPGRALIFDAAVRRLHRDVALHVGVERQYAQRGGVALRLDDAGLERERHHRRQHVAAVGRGVDGVLVRLQLREQEIEIDAGPRPLRDDADLAGERMRAAKTVDLALVGRTHHREQHLVACRDVRGQVGGVEKRAARGAAAHEQAGNGGLHGFDPMAGWSILAVRLRLRHHPPFLTAITFRHGWEPRGMPETPKRAALEPARSAAASCAGSAVSDSGAPRWRGKAR